MKRTLICLIALCSMGYSNVNTSEMNVIKSIIPGSKIIDAEKSPIDGLYIVMLENKKFLYVYPFKKIIFFGEMMSNKGQNISVALKDKLLKDNISNDEIIKEIKSNKDALKSMKETALKVIYGRGSKDYDLYTFTDPDCPFCQTLEKEFSQANIDVNYMFTPIERLHPLAAHKAKQLISDREHIPMMLEKIRKGESVNTSIDSTSKLVLERMKKVANIFKFESTPVIIVIDKKTNTVIDFIQGADLKKLKKYTKGEKHE